MFFTRIWCLSIFILLISCKPDSSAIQHKELVSEWPKQQDKVEDIFSYYESVILNSSSIGTAVYSAKKDGKWGVVDRANQVYFPFEYDTIICNKSNMALKKGGAFEIYDSDRTLLASLKADDLRPILSNFFVSEKNGNVALVNPNGMIILDHRFEQVSGPKDESYFLGKEDEKWSAFDMAGSSIDSTSIASTAAQWLSEFSISLKAYGALRIGSSRGEIEKAIGRSMTKASDDGDCMMYSLGPDFLDVQLMFNRENGSDMALERIYINAPGIVTRSGIEIGSSKQAVLKAYGDKITEQVNKYDENVNDLFYVPTDRKDRNYRLHFLSRNGIIESFSVGRLPSIEFVEGCR